MKHLFLLGVAAILLAACEPADNFTPGIPTILQCKSIATGVEVINRYEQKGTYFRNEQLLIKSRTAEGKRVWTFTSGDLVCVETEQ